MADVNVDELLEQFDGGESDIQEDDEMFLMETVSGPMRMTSVRLPEFLLLALEKAEGSSSDRSSMIRASVVDWLKENNPDALIEAKREVEFQIKQEHERHKDPA